MQSPFHPITTLPKDKGMLTIHLVTGGLLSPVIYIDDLDMFVDMFNSKPIPKKTIYQWAECDEIKSALQVEECPKDIRDQVIKDIQERIQKSREDRASAFAEVLTHIFNRK